MHLSIKQNTGGNGHHIWAAVYWGAEELQRLGLKRISVFVSVVSAERHFGQLLRTYDSLSSSRITQNLQLNSEVLPYNKAHTLQNGSIMVRNNATLLLFLLVQV